MKTRHGQDHFAVVCILMVALLRWATSKSPPLCWEPVVWTTSPGFCRFFTSGRIADTLQHLMDTEGCPGTHRGLLRDGVSACGGSSDQGEMEVPCLARTSSALCRQSGTMSVTVRPHYRAHAPDPMGSHAAQSRLVLGGAPRAPHGEVGIPLWAGPGWGTGREQQLCAV